MVLFCNELGTRKLVLRCYCYCNCHSSYLSSNLSIYNVKYVSREVWSINFLFQGYNRKAKFIATQGMKGYRMIFFVTPFRPLQTWSRVENWSFYLNYDNADNLPYLNVKSTWRQRNFDSCKWTCRQAKCWFI